MKHTLKIILLLTLTLSALSSCVTYKKTAYLQDIPQEAPLEAFQIVEYRLQPGDMLFIKFLSIDPNATEMFNISSGNTSTMMSSESSMQMLSFLVDSKGDIDLPFMGKIPVQGQTLDAAKDSISVRLNNLLKDADVVVKLINKKISILGEVNRPGQQYIYKDNITIYEALAMAGDVSTFGDRTRVRLIRNTPDGQLVRTFSLLDKEALAQPNLIMPNDILFVDPAKDKVFGFKEIPWSLLLSTVSTTILLLNYIK